MTKIPISNVTLIIYMSFVVGSSLIALLLPIYVNKPTCETIPEAKALNQKHLQNNHLSSDYKSRKASQKHLRIREQLENSLPEKLVLKNYAKTNITYCPELLNPQPVNYPWYETRLPTNVYPIHYDLYLNLPLWTIKPSIYDGYVDITVDITEPTDIFMMHVALNGLPVFQNFTDKFGNEVTIACEAEFKALDYYILKTKEKLNVENGPFKISLFFIAALNEFESGLFEFNFASDADPSNKNLTMLASRFEPLDARKAFPCFDEPNLKATFKIEIDHPQGTIAVSNTPNKEDSNPGGNSEITSSFEITQRMPTSLIGIAVFYEKDFKSVSSQTKSGIPIKVWSRNHFIDEGQADMALEIAVKIFDELEQIFINVDKSSLPAKIDILAIPDYPNDAVPHFGLPIFAENKILMKNSSASERNKQDTALLIAKQLAEFWFGNFVTFKWWDELWLQESLGDYIKYFVVERVYPEFNIRQQFITEELVNVLIDDGYPSSHPILKPLNDPYEIEQYFDNIERSKGAAILRMVEIEIGETLFFEAITAFLNANIWGTGDFNIFLNQIGTIGKWSAKDFFDRWLTQPNYPVLFVNLIQTGSKKFSINIKHDRHLNSEFSIFSGDLLYPSAYDFTWFIPLTCAFGFVEQGYNQVHTETFYIDAKDSTYNVSGSKQYSWVQCDRQFSGYYVISYTVSNWRLLASELKTNQQNFEVEDRSSLIHHAFVEGFTDRSGYSTVVDILSYLIDEKDYLPWRTVYHHVNNLLKVLDYDKAFFQITTFFTSELSKLERDDLWEPSDVHIQELLSETILELSCRLQDFYCINKTAELWPLALNEQMDSINNTLPPYVRSIVYNYHFQNTYDVKDWNLFFRLYDTQNDILEEERYLKALTFTRLPWLLSELLESVDRINSLDLFDLLKYLSNQPVGREMAWDYLRTNFNDLIEKFGEDDPRLGQLLLDITSSFENEFMFNELLEFVFYTDTGATSNARFKALEIASTNLIWLIDNEKELINSFGSVGSVNKRLENLNKHAILNNRDVSSDLIKFKLKEMYKTIQAHPKKNLNVSSRKI